MPSPHSSHDLLRKAKGCRTEFGDGEVQQEQVEICPQLHRLIFLLYSTLFHLPPLRFCTVPTNAGIEHDMKMFKTEVDCGKFFKIYMEERIIKMKKNYSRSYFLCLLTQKAYENLIHQHSFKKKWHGEGDLCCPRVSQVIF